MVKKIISYILVFLLIITLLTSIITTILKQTILKEKYILKLLSKNDYYSKTYNEIVEKFKDNTIQTGLTEEVLEEIISQDKVYNDINSLIEYLYNNTEKIEIDTENIKIKLQENINKQIEENNKKVSKDEQESINTYVETITKIYNNSIIYSEQYVQQVQKAITSVNIILNKIQIISYMLFVILLILIIVINKKESYKYLSITSTATGILFILVRIIEKSSMKIQNLLILNKAFSQVLINLIENTIINLLTIGITLFIIGIALNFIKNKDAITKK